MDAPEDCLAHCPSCGTHLDEPFNASLTRCDICRTNYRIRLFPCTCPASIPEDMNARLYPLDELSAVRAEIAASDFSTQRKRVLLLVTLVPRGSYSTVAAIKDCMNENFQWTGRGAILSALGKNEWEDVPVHRVMDFGSGSCLSGTQSNVLDGQGGRALLWDEGVKLDKRGRARGAAFRFF